MVFARAQQVIESTKSDLVLFPHTYQVRDFAPKLAASSQRHDRRLHRLPNEVGKLVFVRQMFRERPPRTSRSLVSPVVASFQSGAFRADLLAAHPSGRRQ